MPHTRCYLKSALHWKCLSYKVMRWRRWMEDRVSKGRKLTVGATSVVMFEQFKQQKECCVIFFFLLILYSTTRSKESMRSCTSLLEGKQLLYNIQVSVVYLGTWLMMPFKNRLGTPCKYIMSLPFTIIFYSLKGPVSASHRNRTQTQTVPCVLNVYWQSSSIHICSMLLTPL